MKITRKHLIFFAKNLVWNLVGIFVLTFIFHQFTEEGPYSLTEHFTQYAFLAILLAVMNTVQQILLKYVTFYIPINKRDKAIDLLKSMGFYPVENPGNATEIWRHEHIIEVRIFEENDTLKMEVPKQLEASFRLLSSPNTN
jgi:hypothetical protein